MGNKLAWLGPLMSIGAIACAFSGVAVVFIWWDWYATTHFASRAEAAAFGESFNFAGVVFSGLAFGGVIITLLLQSRELALQRQELAKTADELSLQRVELNRTANAQYRSEQTLFWTAYLNALNSALNGYGASGISSDPFSNKYFDTLAEIELIRDLLRGSASSGKPVDMPTQCDILRNELRNWSQAFATVRQRLNYTHELGETDSPPALLDSAWSRFVSMGTTANISDPVEMSIRTNLIAIAKKVHDGPDFTGVASPHETTLRWTDFLFAIENHLDGIVAR